MRIWFAFVATLAGIGLHHAADAQNFSGYPDNFGTRQNFACYTSPTNSLQSRATVAIVNPGASLCTGTLVNNTSGRLLVLTAKHCQSDPLANTGAADAPRLQFTWAAITPCDTSNTSAVGPLSGITSTGARHISEWQDTWLLELDAPPPRSANAYMLGYDATDVIPEIIQIVHHANSLNQQFMTRPRAGLPYLFNNPSPEAARSAGITHEQTGTDPTAPEYPLPELGTRANTSKVDIENIGIGRIDGGSSGSAMVDQNQRLIGITNRGTGGADSANGDRFGSAWSRTYNTFFPDQVMDGRDAPLPVAPVPTVSLTVPATAANNASITISWSSTNASSCISSGTWTGNRPTSGSTAVTVTNPNPAGGGAVNRNFTLTCTGDGGEAMATGTVSVAATPSAGGTSGGTTGGAPSASGGGSFSILSLAAAIMAVFRRRRRI